MFDDSPAFHKNGARCCVFAFQLWGISSCSGLIKRKRTNSHSCLSYYMKTGGEFGFRHLLKIFWGYSETLKIRISSSLCYRVPKVGPSLRRGRLFSGVLSSSYHGLPFRNQPWRTLPDAGTGRLGHKAALE